MKNSIIYISIFINSTYLLAQPSQIENSDIYYDTNSTVIGNGGTFFQPYGGYSNQNNSALQLFGNSTNYGIPNLIFVKKYHGHQYGGSLVWTSDSFTANDKRFAQISANVTNSEGSLSFLTRKESDPSGQFNTMMMNEDGNVGIGTTSPSTKLEIHVASSELYKI